MKLRLKDLDSLNLHDSKLLRVEECAENILMEFDAGIIYLPLRQHDCKAWLIQKCSLLFQGVTSSEKKSGMKAAQSSGTMSDCFNRFLAKACQLMKLDRSK